MQGKCLGTHTTSKWQRQDLYAYLPPEPISNHHTSVFSSIDIEKHDLNFTSEF